MRFKDFAIKADESTGDGGFTGYAATFDREPDSYGDVIAKGAFTDTLAAWRESGKPIPLLYGHNMEDPDYNIGYADLAEDETGLLAEAHFDASPKAQRVRELVREGRLWKMSFAFDVLDEASVELENGVKANELRKLDLYEVSVVLVPANSHAEIIDAKSRAKYGATISKATGDALRSIADCISDAVSALNSALEALNPLLPDTQEGDDADQEPDEEDPDGDNSKAKSCELIKAIDKAIKE